MTTLTRTSPELPAHVVTLQALYNYRCALYAAQQAGGDAPTPPALTAEAWIDAYGAAMNRYGAPYVTFAEWHAQQQTPQGPRTFVVVGER